MNIKIALAAQESDQFGLDALMMLARNMNIDLNSDFDAKLEEREGVVGGKGGVELGTIIMTLIGAGGVATSLIGVFNTYLSRAPQLELELEKENGEKIKLTATSVEPDKINETIKLIDKYLKD